MSDRKQIAIIFGIAFVVAFASLVWMAGEIDKNVQENKQVGVVSIDSFCKGGLEPRPTFCAKGNEYGLKVVTDVPSGNLKVVDAKTVGELEVVNNSGRQKTADVRLIQGGW